VEAANDAQTGDVHGNGIPNRTGNPIDVCETDNPVHKLTTDKPPSPVLINVQIRAIFEHLGFTR